VGDDREGVPTPRTSSSFQGFFIRATDLANQLELFARLKWKKVADAQAAKDAARADEMVIVLRKLAERFALWPTLNPEAVAFERAELPPQLDRLKAEAVEMFTR
jgi:hypothetical protein